MKIKKIIYYIKSLSQLFKSLQNPLSLLALLQDKTILKLKSGLRFSVRTPLDALIMKETILDDFYNLKSMKKKNPKTIIDIGAGFGDFAIYAATQFPNAIVLAFEPNPHLFQLLQDNVRLNKVGNIHIFQRAIFHKSRMTLFIPQEHTQSTRYPAAKNHKKIISATTSLSEVLNKHSSISFLKIDCEGGEKEIFEHLTQAQMSRIHTISMEYHDNLVPGISDYIVHKLKPRFTYIKTNDKYDETIGHLFFQNKKEGRVFLPG